MATIRNKQYLLAGSQLNDQQPNIGEYMKDSLVRDAYAFAHELFREKSYGFYPYIVHLNQVAETVYEVSNGHTSTQRLAEELAGALLHDAVEDFPDKVSLGDIEAQFGHRVRCIVELSSDATEPGVRKSTSWRKRKEAYLERLGQSPMIDPWAEDNGLLASSLVVNAADKLCNLRSTIRNLALSRKLDDKSGWRTLLNYDEGQITKGAEVQAGDLPHQQEDAFLDGFNGDWESRHWYDTQIHEIYQQLAPAVSDPRFYNLEDQYGQELQRLEKLLQERTADVPGRG